MKADFIIRGGRVMDPYTGADEIKDIWSVIPESRTRKENMWNADISSMPTAVSLRRD